MKKKHENPKQTDVTFMSIAVIQFSFGMESLGHMTWRL